MKTATHRFVREYANYKIRTLEDLAKWSPDESKASALKGRAYYIGKLVQRWQDGIILTDECMKLIAEA